VLAFVFLRSIITCKTIKLPRGWPSQLKGYADDIW
jgi:hypothetical protein